MCLMDAVLQAYISQRTSVQDFVKAIKLVTHIDQLIYFFFFSDTHYNKLNKKK